MEKNSPENQFLRLKIGSDLGNMVLHNRMRQIFDILSFWKNMATFPGNKRDFLRFSLFSRGKVPIFFQKLKISKICCMRLWRAMGWRSGPIFGHRYWSGEKLFQFLTIFGKSRLKFGKCMENVDFRDTQHAISRQRSIFSNSVKSAWFVSLSSFIWDSLDFLTQDPPYRLKG